MVQIVLIGIAAGIAAALLFASIVSGALISLVLFYLAPLPILIVSLGWSHWAGLIGAVVAAGGLAAVFSGNLFLAFLIGIGLPSWWIGYLALLARPVATPAGTVLEWYPAGRITLWVAGLSSLVVVSVLFTLGMTEESVHGELRRGFEVLLRRSGSPAGPVEDASRIDTLVSMAPPAAAISITLVNLAMVWLAGRIVKTSKRLRRPWPDIAQMTFPPTAAALLAAAMIGTLLAGLTSIISGVVAASLATAYAVLGFAVLHSISRGVSARSLLLAIAYVAVVLIWPVLVLIALLGLTDSLFDIRGRIARKRGPPPPALRN